MVIRNCRGSGGIASSVLPVMSMLSEGQGQRKLKGSMKMNECEECKETIANLLL